MLEDPQGITGVLSVTLNHYWIDGKPVQSRTSGITRSNAAFLKIHQWTLARVMVKIR